MIKGIFLERLNRFVVTCDLGGRTVRAHLPNPGRLWELLLPGRPVYLAERTTSADAATPFTVLAVERDGVPVFLHTQKTNDVAGALLQAGRVTGLEGARIVRREVSYGRSRFDFLLDKNGREIILEVKSCTLFGRHTAMFPDAVTDRGRRHLEDLAALAGEDRSCGVLFIVHTPAVRFFMPDYHTDLAFARTFLALRGKLFFRAVAVSWDRHLALGGQTRALVIPWTFLEAEVRDRGSYLLCLHLPEDADIRVGALGRVYFRKGYYLYAGSAAKDLSQRLARHLRRRKRCHWHIDYLRERATSCTALPIRTSAALEHALASSVSGIADWSIPRFGSSDCSCGTHLYALAENPLHTARFIDLLLHYRMDRLLPGCDAAAPAR